MPWFQYTELNLGPLTIQVWGLLLSLAFATGIWLAYRELKRKNLPSKIILDLAIWLIISAIIGARLFYVLNEWGEFRNNLADIFKIWEGGMALYGGVAGGSLAVWFFLRRKKLDFLNYADAILFVLPAS
ncbi:prolipoprotein diacylglyceryl transferase, partial [Patescibacteria group bacterium]|nr:prolipoprotein diacylglyceryl transferase [Patescibacteria group bacterium]